MPPITDPAAIRRRLAADRAWSVYALGDLAPGLFQHTTWHASSDDDALLMLFSAFDTPVVFTIGAAASIDGLLAEINSPPRLYLSIRPEVLSLIHARYTVSHETGMWRMVLDPACFSALPPAAVRLTLADFPALTRLHADGEPTGETPDFFAAYMVEQGVFYGIYEGQSLVATAGTHLVAPSEGVAAVGNVYTRRDRRGQGLATLVTGAVVSDLLRILPAGAIIALNVMQANLAALKVYERLGFVRHCAFFEGLAARAWL
jgi:ribosomal protein S18 acetylase RimI-like enzyme